MSKVEASIEKYSSYYALCSRFCLCLSLFWCANFNVTTWDVQVNLLMPMLQSLAAPLLAATTAGEVVLGIAILIGYMTRQIALLSAVYTLTSGCIINSFWGGESSLQTNAALNFFQSFGVAGGFLMLAAFGPGTLSVDEKLKEPPIKSEAPTENKL